MRIIPYVHMDNEYSISDSTMVGVFEKMKASNLVKVVFSGGEVQSSEQFLRFSKNPRNVIHLMIEDNIVVQIAWLNKWGHNHAFVHTCMFPEIWGKRTLEAGMMALKYMFGFEKEGQPILDVILSKTSAKNRLINKYLDNIGFHHLGIVPGISKDFYNGANQDAVFKYIKREDVA